MCLILTFGPLPSNTADGCGLWQSTVNIGLLLTASVRTWVFERMQTWWMVSEI